MTKVKKLKTAGMAEVPFSGTLRSGFPSTMGNVHNDIESIVNRGIAEPKKLQKILTETVSLQLLIFAHEKIRTNYRLPSTVKSGLLELISNNPAYEEEKRKKEEKERRKKKKKKE